jgi:carboxyl-terminal processing protease
MDNVNCGWGGTMARRCGPIVLTVLLFVTACAGAREYAHPDTPNALPSGSTRFFATAYDQLFEKYIKPVALRDVAQNGFNNLSKIDPKFSVTRVDDRYDVVYDQEILASYKRPKDDDGYGWGQMTVAAIDVGREHSPALRAADSEKIYQTMIQGMLSHLDVYSRYAGKVAAGEQRASRDGFGGIGITIEDKDKKVRVATVMDDTPAARSGLRQGDDIVQIDDEPTVNLTTADVVERLRGSVGAPVRLTVARSGATAPVELSMVRALIVPPSVVYKREGDTAYVHVLTFNSETGEALTAAVRRARREIGPNLDGMILDLRGNLGGLLDQAVATADLFLSDGAIVSTRGRHPASAQASFAAKGQIGEGIPLVVLVNGSSASASEIVAAALQDNGRAVVVGTATYGKGTVQTVIPMPNDGELILTWARFFSPSGYPIADLGVMPMVCTNPTQPANFYVDEVKNGQATSAATMVKWRSADHEDMASLKQLRQICPPDTHEHDADLDVARALLGDRKLYARALSAATMSAEAKPVPAKSAEAKADAK